MNQEFIVGPNDAGKRLDKFLAEHCLFLSRQKLHRYIDSGCVLVNTRAKKPSFHLHSNDKISLCISEEKKELKPYSLPITIIYEDSDILVLEKPQGLLTHPVQPEQKQTVVNALIALRKELYDTKQALRPGIVHRLDKDTSGVMVVAKTQLSYENLQKQFKARSIDKEYRAICHGVIQKDSWRIDLPLRRDTRNRCKMKVSFCNSKYAFTELTVLERFRQSTYLSLHILTGRMHQIRVHLNFLGYPIIGDTTYGIKDKYSTMFLHAYRLCFEHPRTHKRMEFTSELPAHFCSYLKEQQCIK